jgi:hypothetical protein
MADDSLSAVIDDPDIADHPGALHYFALLGSAQTNLVVTQKHLYAFFNRRRIRKIEQLARVDAREKIAHRLLPQIRSKNAFRHACSLQCAPCDHAIKLGVLNSMRHCEEVPFHYSVEFGDYRAG